MPDPVSLCIPESEVEPLLHALEWAGREWSRDREVGGAGKFSTNALDARRLHAALAFSPVVAGCRRVSVEGDLTDALHTVARGCESAGDREAEIARLVRTVADLAALGDGRCLRTVRMR